MPGPKRAAKIEAKKKRRAELAQDEDVQVPSTQHVDSLEEPDTPSEESEVELTGERYDETYNRLPDEDLGELSKRELQNLARERAVSTEGTKAEIIARLRGEG